MLPFSHGTATLILQSNKHGGLSFTFFEYSCCPDFGSPPLLEVERIITVRTDFESGCARDERTEDRVMEDVNEYNNAFRCCQFFSGEPAAAPTAGGGRDRFRLRRLIASQET